MKTLAFEIIGNVHIVVAGATEPTDEDWNAYMAAVRAEEKRGANFAKMRTCVFSAGGGPNSRQRRLASEFLGGRATPVAIVTSSAFLRGVVAALAWFNPLTHGFASDNVIGALHFLGIPEEHHATIWASAKRLQATLESPPTKIFDAQQIEPPSVRG